MRIMRWPALAIALQLGILAPARGASDPVPPPEPAEAEAGLPSEVAEESEDAEELAALLDLLDEETAIATKTRMNSDYVPGIVTVLQGEELEALGIETVWEALELVPGIQPVRGTAGSPSVIVRGVQFPFNSGNIKVLIDGVPVSRQNSGVDGVVLFMPVEQVERIEVIRGPGSVVYGDFAFMGLVNIVTRRQPSQVFVRATSEDGLTAGARVGAGSADGPWQVSVDLSASSWDDAVVPRGREGEEERHHALASARYGGFSILAQHIGREADDTTAPPPPPTAGPPFVSDETTWGVEARYEHHWSETLSAALRAGRLETDVVGGPGAFEDRLDRFGLDLQWDGLAGQSWLAAAEYSGQSIVQARLNRPPPVGPILVDDVDRDTVSFTLQDQLDLGERWSVTVGARYDDVSDVDDRVTPRLSLVWRASDRHILKAQYAEGFRTPTFFEEYGGGRENPDLGFEVNATTELNYVFRAGGMVGRATLFHSELDDMIFVRGRVWDNSRRAEAEGIELEWSQQLTGWLKLFSSLAMVETEDTRGATMAVHESEAAADWTGDLGFIARLGSGASATTHWYHVDEREALRGDDGYDLVDVTLNAHRVWWPGLSARIGVENVLDDDVSYVAVPPTGIIGSTVYPGRRAFWAQLAWQW